MAMKPDVGVSMTVAFRYKRYTIQSRSAFHPTRKTSYLPLS